MSIKDESAATPVSKFMTKTVVTPSWKRPRYKVYKIEGGVYITNVIFRKATTRTTFKHVISSRTSYCRFKLRQVIIVCMCEINIDWLSRTFTI